MKTKYLVEIHEAERELIFCDNDDLFIEHIKKNDPVLVGTVDVDDEDAMRLHGAFRTDSGFVSLGGAYDRYAEQLGLKT